MCMRALWGESAVLVAGADTHAGRVHPSGRRTRGRPPRVISSRGISALSDVALAAISPAAPLGIALRGMVRNVKIRGNLCGLSRLRVNGFGAPARRASRSRRARTARPDRTGPNSLAAAESLARQVCTAQTGLYGAELACVVPDPRSFQRSGRAVLTIRRARLKHT
jgi:hypothetical protein